MTVSTELISNAVEEIIYTNYGPFLLLVGLGKKEFFLGPETTRRRMDDEPCHTVQAVAVFSHEKFVEQHDQQQNEESTGNGNWRLS
ncbi:hypothetical protein PT974_03778 [Cladobotryum mycophilum]|uniref:Uncharacterized protein n=1 Tax=Cladobotryum mycophilum TaxID=491253 RepID=A0ABR0STL8_9HYPO